MNKIAVFPGSFDPFTYGHKNIVERAIPLFDKIIIAIGINAEKKTMFDADQRIAVINPVLDLILGSTYQAIVTTDVRDIYGNKIEEVYTNTFQTID